ncbi:MAG: NAD(P)/FAD-dependent oxidoreductase [bacterium]
MNNEKKTAIIIGAGPAGLTAALELLEKTDIKPIVLEEDKQTGGIAKTLNFNGNLVDIGGHRFFSKSDLIMKMWENLLPFKEDGPEVGKDVMIFRNRKSRIYFLKKFFDYPVSLNWNTVKNLGIFRMMKIGFSYVRAVIFPIRPEKNLEDFFINRFGRELYKTFFEFYTEKLWGRLCREISAEWGAQRVKGVSIAKAIMDSFRKKFFKSDIKQKNIETSLIERFLYPKYGPGQLWEKMADIIKEKGGKIILGQRVVVVKHENNKVTAVEAENNNGERRIFSGDIFFSTMPIKDLIASMGENVQSEVREAASGLEYRDMVLSAMLLKKINLQEKDGGMIKDNWIYLQEREMRAGRMQIGNNWSPYLVRDKNKVWISLEYFCDEGDDFWRKSDTEIKEEAEKELIENNIINNNDLEECFIKRVCKAYPAYFENYKKFPIIKNYIDKFENLFLIGRNGMHKYNNMDHSMMTAITAVDNIVKNRKDKSNIWDVNTEKEYHEEGK